MQYSAEIHIKVSSPDVWRRFEDQHYENFQLAELAERNKTSFTHWGDWGVDERELDKMVMSLSKTLGREGIIIARTTNISVDVYHYNVAYLGSNIHHAYERGDAFGTEIISDWLNDANFYVSDQEKEVLLRCGVAVVGRHFAEFSTDLKLPDRICLRETSFQNRPETIENTLAGEEVYFVLAPNSYDPLCVEVMSELGSLGYLPSDAGEQLAPALASKRLQYTARVQEVIPASKRNKHAKSSIVSIHIDAEFSDEEVPMKTSVPKVGRRKMLSE